MPLLVQLYYFLTPSLLYLSLALELLTGLSFSLFTISLAELSCQMAPVNLLTTTLILTNSITTLGKSAGFVITGEVY